MADYDKIVRERQGLIRRQMDAQRITIKQVQYDGGWESASTVLSYFPADAEKVPATMSVAALFRLLETKALSAELLSLLLPEGHAIVRVPEGIDLDDFEEVMRDILATKAKAHRPDSPGGREIADCERVQLERKVVSLVRKVA